MGHPPPPEEWAERVREGLAEVEKQRQAHPPPGGGAGPLDHLFSQLPRYLRGELLGEGASAVVYGAVDRELNRPVAIKLLREAVGFSEVARERFRREAQAAAGLSHPNVVTVYDAGEVQGQLYLVMERVEGRSFADLLKQGERDERRIVTLLQKAARGVAAAHAQGIVHRDLKPANILIGSTGEPKVGDFGLAHLMSSNADLTKSGAALGTPLYMAPEQVMGRTEEITPRTDVYGLGAILYEAMTGRPVHSGASIQEIYAAILKEDPVRPLKLNPKIAGQLETVILKALERDPSRRYASADEFADDLGRYLEGVPVVARLPSAGYRIRRHLSRNRWGYWVGASILAGAVAAAGVWIGASAKADRLSRERAAERGEAVRQLRETSRILLDAALRLSRKGESMDNLMPYVEKMKEAHAAALVRAPDAAEVDYLMGRMYRASLKTGPSWECQQQALRKDPEFAPALYEAIVVGYQLYLYEYSSRPVTEEKAKERARNCAWWVATVSGYCKTLDRVADASVSRAQLFSVKARRALVEERLDEATGHLESAVREDPMLEEAWDMYAQLVGGWTVLGPPASGREREKKLEAGEAIYTRAIAHDQGYVLYRLHRGIMRTEIARCRFRRGEDPFDSIARADQDFEQASLISSRMPPPWCLRGVAWEQAARFRLARNEDPSKEVAAAISHSETALRVCTGDYAEARVTIAASRISAGDFKRTRGQDPTTDFAEAGKILNAVLEREPKYIPALTQFGRLHTRRGLFLHGQSQDPKPDWDAAQTALANLGDPEAVAARAWLQVHRAAFHEKKGDRSTARSALSASVDDFREAIRLDPGLEGELGRPLADAERKLAALKEP